MHCSWFWGQIATLSLMVSKYDLGQEWQGRGLLYEFRLRLEQEFQKTLKIRWKWWVSNCFVWTNWLLTFSAGFVVVNLMPLIPLQFLNIALDEMIITFWKDLESLLLKTKNHHKISFDNLKTNLKLNSFAQRLLQQSYFKSVPPPLICATALFISCLRYVLRNSLCHFKIGHPIILDYGKSVGQSKTPNGTPNI